MERKKRAVLLLTVCRRYHELVRNLANTRALAEVELGYVPDVILVWARPEVTRLWLFEGLLARGDIQHVIGRPELNDEGDDKATTYPESINIRQGLEYIRSKYDPETHYVIMHAADVRLNGGTLNFVNHHISEGCQAVLFHWENGCVHSGIWHTNFFAVGLDERYWPPVSYPGHQDVLERHWGMELTEKGLPGIYPWHNYMSRRFVHQHESEGFGAFPRLALEKNENLSLLIVGFKPWYSRVFDFFKWCMSFGRRPKSVRRE